MTAISAVALLAASVAIYASLRRLAAVYRAMTVDPAALVTRLRQGVTVAALAKALRDANAEPEASLVFAMLAPPEERTGRTNEVLMDIDDRFAQWARVPRVAASAASAVGFLLASLALRNGMAISPADDLPPELREVLLYRALFDALNAVAFGLFGAITCVVIHGRARAERRVRMNGVDLLVQELEVRGLPAVDRVV